MKPTQAAIARALDLSQAAVSKLKAQGMPVESIEGAHAWRMRNLDPARMKRAAAPITDPTAAPRCAHDLAQLAAAALKLGRFEAIELRLFPTRARRPMHKTNAEAAFALIRWPAA